MPTNTWPVIIKNIIRFIDHGLSQMVMSIIIGGSQGAIPKSYAVFVRATVYPGASWASIEDDHTKRRPYLSPYNEGEQDSGSLSVRGQCGANQANWTLCLCPYDPKTLSNTWISFKASRQMPQTDSLGSFHYWESELTFDNLTNFKMLANQKVSKIVSQKVSLLWGPTFEG